MDHRIVNHFEWEFPISVLKISTSHFPASTRIAYNLTPMSHTIEMSFPNMISQSHLFISISYWVHKRFWCYPFVDWLRRNDMNSLFRTTCSWTQWKNLRIFSGHASTGSSVYCEYALVQKGHTHYKCWNHLMSGGVNTSQYKNRVNVRNTNVVWYILLDRP